MTCNEVQDNLAAYLHGELDKKTVMEIHQHLSGCEACVQEEIELRQTNRLLDQFRFEALPENFDEQLHQKLKQIETPHQKVSHDLRRIVYAVAATIIIMIGLQFFGSRVFQSLQPPIRLTDFPTTQVVFKSEESSSEPSLKERLVQRYIQARQEKLLGNSVIR